METACQLIVLVRLADRARAMACTQLTYLEAKLARQEGEHRRFTDSLTSEVQRLQHVCGGAVSLRLPPFAAPETDARVPFERDPLCTELTCALIMYGVDPSGTQTPRASPDRRDLGART